MASIQKKNIGLLGGSFDPAHKGHLGISQIAIKKFKFKKLYWVITKKNPFKNKTFYSLEERINYAKKISKISYSDYLNKDIKVMDATAISLAKDRSLPIIIFSILENEPPKIDGDIFTFIIFSLKLTQKKYQNLQYF